MAIKLVSALSTTQHIQFQNSSGVNTGKIEASGDDLIITNAVGNVLFGDLDSNVYIGDGVNSVDILFEQSGAIRSETGSSATITLGSSGTTLNVYNPQIANGASLTSELSIGTGGSINFLPDTGSILELDGQTILKRNTFNGGITLGHDDAVIIAGGDTYNTLESNISLGAETVFLGAEGGVTIYAFPNNDTAWSNRKEFIFSNDTNFYLDGRVYPSDQATNYVDSTRIANWQTAYGWGDHGTEGYATEVWVGEQNYASDSAISTAVASYLPLAGGTMTGTLTINTTAVPFNLIENGHTGTGKYWRIPLDVGNIRFDVDTTNTNGNGTFASYTAVLLLKANGDVQLSNYGAGILKTDANGNISLDTSTYLTSINNGNWSGTDLSVANGGTGASTASAARTNLGLGTAATSASTDFVAVTGDTMTGKLTVEGNGVNWSESTQGTTTGSIHLDPVGTGANNTGSAITFGASDTGGGATAHAGIYTRTDGNYGTKMYFSTTDDYSAGSKTRMMINSNGRVGINTTDPAELLEVNGNIKGSTLYATDDIVLADKILHYGDTDTYFQFDTNRVRIIAGGTTKFDSNVTYAPLASPALTGTPTAPTAAAATNTTQLATTAFVSTAIANLSDSAPATLDTLNELAAALGDDANFSTTVTNSIATKLPKAGGTMTGDLIIGTAASAGLTQAFGNFDQLKFDNSHSDSARGPNKIVMHDNGSSWRGGFGIHSGTVAYYSGDKHIWYKTGSSDSYTERMTLDGSGNLSVDGTLSASGYNKSNWDTAYNWGNHASGGYSTASGVEDNADVTDTANVVAALTAGTNVQIAANGTISATDTDTVYSHPTFNGDDFSIDTGALTGATVISDLDINVTTNSQGHVTDANGSVSTRTLTLANLGYTGATNANYITNNNQLTNGAGYLTSSSTQSKYLRSDTADTATGSLTLSGGANISGGVQGSNSLMHSFFLPQNPEGSHVKAPWFFNDFAYARLRGATVSVTVNGGSSPGNSNIDAMLDASTGFWNMTTSGVTSVVIEMSNLPKTMYHGSHYGVTFGNTNWRAKDVVIETYYSGAWQEVKNVTNQSQEFVYGAKNSGSNAQTKLRWTFSNFNTTSMRIVSLFAYNYNAVGMPSLYLTKNGGEMFGDIDMGTNIISDTKVGQWDTAYGWGNHASGGYSTASGVEDNANNYSLPLGSSSTRGGFKIGYTESGKNYPVELSSEKMFVNVPWTDTQLTTAQVRSNFSAGSNVSITNGTISATNTDTVTSVGVSGSETTGTITLTSAGATTLTQSGQTVEIRSTDTTYTVGDGGLTQKNFTTTLKNKLDGIAASATNVTNNNQLTNGAGYITGINSSAVTTALGYTPYQESTALSATTGSFSGDITVSGNQVITNGANADVKFSVWSGTTYGIGMTSGVTYGGLNDYAMTFCMNNDTDRGFWWGYSGQTKSAGAMSLTTAGVLTVASSITAAGAVTGSNLNISNWDTAYGWGDHASGGYSTASGVEDNADVTDTANVVAALTAGTNVQIAANGTISATDTNTVYTHPTSAGNKHIPSGGAAGQFLKYSSSGTATWATPSYTTNTNTQLSNEQVQDIVGAMFSGNTETNITATYQDGDGTIDLSVAANYGSWDLVADDDTTFRVDTTEHVKFQGANISGTGTEADPFLVNTPDTNTTYTADGNYGMTLNGTAFRLENDRRRNSTTQDIHTGNTHDYTFYDADVGIRWYTAGAEEMRLEDDGDLHVDGDVIAFSTTVSDARLKDDVQTIENATEKVNQLRGVSYTWNEGSRKGQREIGVIAQEVQEVVPEVVHEKKLPFVGDETYKTVDYEKLVALLIESNKELTARVEQLEARLDGSTK